MGDPLADPAPLIRKVYAYVAYRVGVGAEAEDITSETIERASDTGDGARRARTADLLIANQALSQLSYSPE
jgi:DNA-directed RNA polymerase specialized sigma24 family protein